MENSITVNMENLSKDERKQLMKLIEKANKVENKVWKPKEDEIYYFVGSDITAQRDRWEDVKIDNDRYSAGNCFHTKEETEFAVEKLKVIADMKRIAAKDDEVERCLDNTHWFIYYDYEDNELKAYYASRLKSAGTIYFVSKERVQEAIDTIGGNRIKQYLFGIEVEDDRLEWI